jgi:cardiolipin synthase
MDDLRKAHERMLRAIDEAQETIGVASYIFDDSFGGEWRFCEALARAQTRGVKVRILIDAVGGRYAKPSTYQKLRAMGLNARSFIPVHLWGYLPYVNLRLHRKVMVVDGRLAFTGGMNIQPGCWAAGPRGAPIRDCHFEVEGPVVAHLREAFRQDWFFASGEDLRGDGWRPSLVPCGDVAARGIFDGPDGDFETTRWVLLAAMSGARESVTIVTPYFLPDATLRAMMRVAVMRGVSVTVVVPEDCRLRWVRWASREGIRELLEGGVRVLASPEPFDHTKLTLVDRDWVLFGSSNWDPRSLRLNFELNVECRDAALANALATLVEKKIVASRAMTLREFEGRSMGARLRDGVARLFAPYL